MTLQQLKYFIEITKSGSISKAAKCLHIAQPSLSIALRDLEAEIECSLFSRTSTGTYLTREGEEFFRYAKQIIEQMDLLEMRWSTGKRRRPRLHIMSNHYAFAVKAFVSLIKKDDSMQYDYSFREGRTFDIIEDVKTMRSDIGVLYKDRWSQGVIEKVLLENNLEFHMLFTAKIYVLIGAQHPLAEKEYLTVEDLAGLPRISFEKSDYNVLYATENETIAKEYPNAKDHRPPVRKNISVGDRDTMVRILRNINAYTIATGHQGLDLYGDGLRVLPFRSKDPNFIIEVGWISQKNRLLEGQALRYIEELEAVSKECGTEL